MSPKRNGKHCSKYMANPGQKYVLPIFLMWWVNYEKWTSVWLCLSLFFQIWQVDAEDMHTMSKFAAASNFPGKIQYPLSHVSWCKGRRIKSEMQCAFLIPISTLGMLPSRSPYYTLLKSCCHMHPQKSPKQQQQQQNKYLTDELQSPLVSGHVTIIVIPMSSTRQVTRK